MALRPLSGPRLPPARGSATHLVVLLHGYGADGNDLIGLAPHWQRMLPTVAFVAPNAPEPCAGAPTGYQWFPISRLDPQEMRAAHEKLHGEMLDGMKKVLTEEQFKKFEAATREHRPGGPPGARPRERGASDGIPPGVW